MKPFERAENGMDGLGLFGIGKYPVFRRYVLRPVVKMNFATIMVSSVAVLPCSTSSTKKKFWPTERTTTNGMCWWLTRKRPEKSIKMP